MLFSPGLLAWVRRGCLATWKGLPPGLGSSAALMEVLQGQGTDKPYNSLISHLKVADCLFGVQEPENPFTQLAFENANLTCQDILKHHRSKSLAGYVRLCTGTRTSHAICLPTGAVLRRQA